MVIQINAIIDRAIDAIREYKDTEFFPLILDKLARARMGIGSLKLTYKDAPDIVAKLVVCIDNINIQLQKNKDLLPDSIKLDENVSPSSDEIDEDDDTSTI